MTIRVPDDLKREIDRHPEINWSEVARRAMWEYVRKLELADEIASRSELTTADAERLSEDVKHDLTLRYRDDRE